MNRLEFKGAFSVSDAGEITGNAWPFASPDRVGDVIEKGAINAPSAIPMLFAHDQSQAIGVWDSIVATDAGLEVKGRLLIDDVERAREVRALVKVGAVSGLSIGFVTRKALPRKGGGRLIQKLDLHEISIVPIPAHPGARIISLKFTSNRKEGALPDDLIIEGQDAPSYADLEAKFATLEGEVKGFSSLTQRLDRIETCLSRPGASAPAGALDAKEAAALETKAFNGFLRRGVERLSHDEVKSLTSDTTTSGGGFLFTSQYLNEIDKQLTLYSSVRSLASVSTTGVAEVILPKRATTPSVSWVGEGEARTATNATYGQQKIPVFEMAAYTDVSNRLLEDAAFSIEAELASDLGEQFGKEESAAFINGDGEDKPTGIAHNGTIAFTPGDVSLTPFTASTLIELFHSLPSAYAKNAVWAMNRQSLGYVRQLATAMGEYLWTDGLANGNPPTLLGRPVFEMPELPALQTAGTPLAAGSVPIILADWKAGFRIFDRVGVSILRDPYSVQASGLVRFHARRRVGGALTKAEAFRFLKIAA